MKKKTVLRKATALVTVFVFMFISIVPVNAVNVVPAIAKADIIVLMDKTVSMNQELTYAKTATIDFVEELKEENVDCRLGIATFGSHASLNSSNGGMKNWTGFQDFYNNDDVTNEVTTMIDSLATHGYIEQTTKAIDQAADLLESDGRPDAGKMLIIITDSPALEQNSGSLGRDDIAEDLKDKGINTFFIGETNQTQLNAIQIVVGMAQLITQLGSSFSGISGNNENKFSKINQALQTLTSTGTTDEVKLVENIKYTFFKLFSGITYEQSYNEVLAELSSDLALYGRFYSIDNLSAGDKYLASGGLGKGVWPAYLDILSLLLSHYIQTPPVIDSFDVPTTLEVGQDAQITLAVHDLDIDSSGNGDILNYTMILTNPDNSTEAIAVDVADVTSSDATFNGFATKKFAINKTIAKAKLNSAGVYKVKIVVNDLFGAIAESEKPLEMLSMTPPTISELDDRVTAATKNLSIEQNKYLPGSEIITKAVFNTGVNSINSYYVTFNADATSNSQIDITSLKVIGVKVGDTATDYSITSPAQSGSSVSYTVGSNPGTNTVTMYFKYKFTKNTSSALASAELKNKVTIVATKGAKTSTSELENTIKIRDAKVKLQ